jgi:hypothetical protein
MRAGTRLQDGPERRSAGEPGSPEPAPVELLRLLGRSAGNHAVSSLLADRALLQREIAVKRGSATEQVWAEERDRERVEALVDAIEQYGALDSLRAQEITRSRFKRWGGGTMTRQDVLEQVKAQGWYVHELEGLKAALDVAGGVPQLKEGDDDEVTWVEDEAGWVFGKLTGTIGGRTGKYVAPGSGGGGGGETIGPLHTRGPWSINLVGDCDATVFEMEPEPDPYAPQAEKDAASVRRARGTFVHEIGHTLWPRFKDGWAQHIDGPAKEEQSPTAYGRDRGSEEDFCDSFMLYALYESELSSRAPERKKFFDAHEKLLNLNRARAAPPPVPA